MYLPYMVISLTKPITSLPAAMALGQATQSLALVVGWATGGVLLAAVGTSGALAVNAGSFLVSASFLLRLPSLRTHVADTDSAPSPRCLRSSLSFRGSTPISTNSPSQLRDAFIVGGR